jgi:hypothetical protein
MVNKLITEGILKKGGVNTNSNTVNKPNITPPPLSSNISNSNIDFRFGELKIIENMIKFERTYMDGTVKVVEMDRRDVFNILTGYDIVKKSECSWIKCGKVALVNEDYFHKVLDYMEYERGKNLEYYKNRLEYYKSIIIRLQKFINEIKGLNE